MKRAILPLLVSALLLSSVSLKAQESKLEKNELKVGYSVVTAPEIGTGFALMFLGIPDQIGKDSIKDLSLSAYGAVSISYERELKKWVGLGITGVFNPMNITNTTTKGQDYSFTWYVTSLMANVNFYYLRKPVVSLYSGAAVGATLIIENDYGKSLEKSTQTDLTYAFQLNFFGVRIGKQIAGFMEFGYGWKGIMNFGISAKL